MVSRKWKAFLLRVDVSRSRIVCEEFLRPSLDSESGFRCVHERSMSNRKISEAASPAALVARWHDPPASWLVRSPEGRVLDLLAVRSLVGKAEVEELVVGGVGRCRVSRLWGWEIQVPRVLLRGLDVRKV